MSELRRVRTAQGAVRIALLPGDGSARLVATPTLAALLALPLDQARSLVTDALGGRPLDVVATLAPVDGATEVWACGVTYLRSRDARMAESATADVYDRVYAATRPELFLKSLAHKVVADGDPIGIRADSTIDVPEPELALVLTATGETFGYTICDDVSSRSIEGENPLYLPQAKIYAGACALGPGIRPAWEIDPADLEISLLVRRGDVEVFAGATSTSQLHRTPADLVEHLFRGDHFPAGAVLSTGTGVVPPLDTPLVPGDVVTITIEGIGTLTNPVLRGKQSFAALGTA